MRIKLLRNIAPYQTTIDRKKNKRTSIKGEAGAGDVIDLPREQADIYIEGENALPVDSNGDITEAGMELLGVEDFEDLGATQIDPATGNRWRGRWIRLSEVEIQRWDKVSRRRSGQDQEVKAKRGRRKAAAKKEIAETEV